MAASLASLPAAVLPFGSHLQKPRRRPSPQSVRALRRGLAAGGLQSGPAARAPDGFALPASRAERAAVRVALRQLAHTDGHHPMLAAWRQAFDRLEQAEE